jgi:hypothetical protein
MATNHLKTGVQPGLETLYISYITQILDSIKQVVFLQFSPKSNTAELIEIKSYIILSAFC